MNFTLWQFTKRVFEANRVIQAVSKHVIAQNTLAGGCVGVGINKPAYLGIVITGLEVVELGLNIVQLTYKVPDGIVSEVFAVHCGEQVGPGAVAVGVAVAVAPGGNLGFPPGVCCYLLVIQTVPQFRELQIFLAAPNSFWLFPKAAVHIVRDFY